MTVKQKPIPNIVKKAAKLIKNPETASKKDVKEMAARIPDDEKYAPKPHNPVKPSKPTKKK